MSPRAAWRLERLGFTAYDYVGGKSDWLSRGLAYEGTADLVSRHLAPAPTCEATESVAAVRERFGAVEVVVVDGGLAVGVLAPEPMSAAASVEAAMTFGMTTVRASEERVDLDERLSDAGVARAIVTDPDACLLGIYSAHRP